MKKLSCLFLLFIFTISIFSGCASKTAAVSDVSRSSSSAVAGQKEKNAPAANSTGSKENVVQMTSKDQYGNFLADVNVKALTSSGATDSNNTASNAILAQRKVIRNANISLEVDDFNIAYGQIKSIIGAFGYIQESNIKKDKIYVNSQQKLITKGVIVIRVDKDRFDSVLSDVQGLGTLMDQSIKGDDVTDQFIDTESMLRLLKYEESRLEEYLYKLTDPDTIFKTQSRLTEIRQQIEKLTGNLKKWTDLVELSTITINITEKGPGSIQSKEPGYFEKLLNGFSNSFKGIISFLGAVLIFIAQALPVLVLIAIIAVLALWVYRRYIKKYVDKKDGQNDK